MGRRRSGQNKMTVTDTVIFFYEHIFELNNFRVVLFCMLACALRWRMRVNFFDLQQQSIFSWGPTCRWLLTRGAPGTIQLWTHLHLSPLLQVPSKVLGPHRDRDCRLVHLSTLPSSAHPPLHQFRPIHGLIIYRT